MFTFRINDPSRSNVELQTQETNSCTNKKYESPQKPFAQERCSDEMNLEENYEDVSDQSHYYKPLMIQKQKFEDSSIYTLPYHHVR